MSQRNKMDEMSFERLIEEERTRPMAPISSWEAIAATLKQDGFITEPSNGAQAVRPASFARFRRFASISIPAVTFLIIGFFAGRMTLPGAQGEHPNTQQPAGSQIPSAEIVYNDFASIDEAREVMLRSQAEYHNAVAFLNVNGDNATLSHDVATLKERLAALDVVVSAAQNAVQWAPADPVLQQYFISSSGARRATMQLIREQLPEGATLGGF